MIPITDEVRSIIWVFVVIATLIFSVFTALLERDIRFVVGKFLPGIRPGKKPVQKPLYVWLFFFSSGIFAAVGTAVASVAPETQPSIPRVTLPIEFNLPEINKVIEGYEVAGYSKHSCMTSDSNKKLTLFARNDSGNLGFITSIDNGVTWSKFVSFGDLPLTGGQGVSVVIDSADQIHIVWGGTPDASDAYYGLLDSSTNDWVIRKQIVATGTYARDIAVDTANHPHIVWSGLDVSYIFYDGSEWTKPISVLSSAWHPDIAISSLDDVYVVANSGSFYPDPNVSVIYTNNESQYWKSPQIISNSPYWSGGAISAVDNRNSLYLVWLGADTNEGGNDLIYFSMFRDEQWTNPIVIGSIETSGGSTGAESPAIWVDSNNTLFVFWRGLNEKKRPVIFAKSFVTPNTTLEDVGPGWSKTIEIDDRSASNVNWPCITNISAGNNEPGAIIAWNVIVGTKNQVDFAKVIYP